MALINCPECGRQVSEIAPTCPGCGYPVAEKLQIEKEEKQEEAERKRVALEKYLRAEEATRKAEEAERNRNLELMRQGKDFRDSKGTSWRVIDVDTQNKRALFITWCCEKTWYQPKYGYTIEGMYYPQLEEEITWENSWIRKWLNSVYLNSLPEEIWKRVASVVVKNPGNKLCGTSGGKDTQDRVFLLSIDEAKRYFESNVDRFPKNIELYRYLYGKTLTGWWLRTPGCRPNYAAYVRSDDGSVFDFGCDVHNDRGGLRPALWLNL